MPDVEAYCCPMCGWWRPVRYGIAGGGEAREVRFDKVDPATAPMWRLQRLSGAGRGSRDAKIETLDMKGLTDMPEDIKVQIQEQCHRILEVLEG